MPIKGKLKKIKKLPPSKLKPKDPHAPAMETKPRPTKPKRPKKKSPKTTRRVVDNRK